MPDIDLMRHGDVPGCLAVIADTWGPQVAEVARPEFLHAFGPGWPPIFYVARVEGRIVGTAGYVASWLNYGVYSLIYVATLKSHRRQGIATALVGRCLSDIDVLASNVMLTTYVPDFYRSFGFDVLDDDLMCFGKRNVLMRRRCRGVSDASPGGEHGHR